MHRLSQLKLSEMGCRLWVKSLLYGNQYGIKNNGLNSKFSTGGWQPAEVKELSETHPVGFQQLAASATEADLAASIEIGETIGSNLFEVYGTDLKLVSNINSL